MATQFLLGVAAAWILCGFVTGFVMRRRGHDFFVWLALGSILGPLVFPLAVNSLRSDSHIADEHHDRSYPGELDVLVGLDGSEESKQALSSAMNMFGPQASTITLATVIDYDAHGSVSGDEARKESHEMLQRIANSLIHENVRTEVLFGRADRALIDFASSADIELIVVGARGHGASEALFGSVTRNLVGGSSVPVFVGNKPLSVRNPQMRPG